MSHSFSLTPSNKLHARNNFILKQCSGKIGFLCRIRKEMATRAKRYDFGVKSYTHSFSNFIAHNDGPRKHHATDVSHE